ncbi:hypothetical protein LOZ58_004818 [Ophidiomyces ophidiicola]|nr:hypothetical protein LOZ58_004818 [Ophidiomyces ophidiicola]
MPSSTQSNKRDSGFFTLVRRPFERKKRASHTEDQDGNAQIQSRPQESLATTRHAGHDVRTTPNPEVVPAALQEVYEAASRHRIDHANGEVHPPNRPFSEQELKNIFSGAPHFILEKGVNSTWYPHVLFPWDENVSVQNLRDRKPFHHPSHTLSTLHAHLPVCQGGVTSNDNSHGTAVLPTFDLGVFEVPNMLSARAKEPGCIGFRTYLELPIAHASRYTAFTPPSPRRRYIFPQALPSLKNGLYAFCRTQTSPKREEVLRGGPTVWRRLGVRPIPIKTVALRLEQLGELRQDVMFRCQQTNVMDQEKVAELNDQLFSDFLYPLPKDMENSVPAKRGSLKYQIWVLLQVLLVKGVWIDFSLVEWRIRAGQLLWAVPPYQDGDLADIPKEENEDIERRWFLFQLLLTAELVLRFDAALKLGFLGRSTRFLITPRDINQLNELRTPQIDWGIICAHRAIDHLRFKHDAPKVVVGEPRDDDEHKGPRIPQRFLPKMYKGGIRPDSALRCRVLPREPTEQMEGLLVFAKALQWPQVELLEQNLRAKLEVALSDEEEMSWSFDNALRTASILFAPKPCQPEDMYIKSTTSRFLHLQVPPEGVDYNAHYLGGWAARSWLTGFVVPGESAYHLLMAALLENDPLALKRLGPVADVYGGFVYAGRSWWSKFSIIGRVLSTFSAHAISMGWLSSKVLPRDDDGLEIRNSWIQVDARDDHAPPGEARIQQGSKILLESSPLGAEGDLTPGAFSLPLDTPGSDSQGMKVVLKRLTLSRPPGDEPQEDNKPLKGAGLLSFTTQSGQLSPRLVHMPLTFNVQFISSYTCLPPPGYAAQAGSTHAPGARYRAHTPLELGDEYNRDGDLGETALLARKVQPGGPARLPAHPLHTASYPYSFIPVTWLAKMAMLHEMRRQATFMAAPEDFLAFADPQRRRRRSAGVGVGEGAGRAETYIVDARGSLAKEAYARACIPPVVSTGYAPKGRYLSLNGMKTYVTGPESAQHAILVVYVVVKRPPDIFGFFPQTLQGADIVAHADPDREYRVFMPDFFDGAPADISWYPPQTDDQKQKLGHFFETKAPPPNTLARIAGVVAEANALAAGGSGFKAWGMMGYCWGGKITSLAAAKDSLFKAAVQCHPAMVDPKDAEEVTIPMAVLASMDEDAEVIDQYKKNLRVPHHVQTWSTQIHGWMAARGDLADPDVKKEYENGYRAVLAFFHDHM